MEQPKIKWEPENLTPIGMIEDRFSSYIKGKQGVTLLKNGTLLFIKGTGKDALDEANAKLAMKEAKNLIDFEVTELKEGGYLISFHEAVAVFVGLDEYLLVKNEISQRINDLKFEEEVLHGDLNNKHYLIGLYARGKLYRDANNFCFHKRING